MPVYHSPPSTVATESTLTTIAKEATLAAVDTKLARLAPGKGTASKISFTSVSSSWTPVNTDETAKYYTIGCTQYCYVVFGASNVDPAANTDFLLPPGVHDFIVQAGHGVRVVSDGVDGVLCLVPSGA